MTTPDPQPEPTTRRARRSRALARWLPTTLLLAGMLFFLGVRSMLRRHYPGLHDDAPGSDGAWPYVMHVLAAVLAGACLFLALVATSLATSRPGPSGDRPGEGEREPPTEEGGHPSADPTRSTR